MSLTHLLALLMVLGHLVLYSGYLGAKIRVSELEVRYTVREGRGGDGAVVIQTPFGKLVTDASRFRDGQECSGGGRGIFKDPSQRLLVPVNAPYLPKEWNLECAAQGYLYGIPDRPGT